MNGITCTACMRQLMDFMGCMFDASYTRDACQNKKRLERFASQKVLLAWMAVETSCMLMKRRKHCFCMDGMDRWNWWNESFSTCPRNKRKVGNLTNCGINYISTGSQHLSSAGNPPFRLGLHIEYPPSARRLGPQREAKDLADEFRFVSDWFSWSGE